MLTPAADGFELLDSQVSSLTSYLATDTETEDRTVSSGDGYEGPRRFISVNESASTHFQQGEGPVHCENFANLRFPALLSKRVYDCIIAH